MLLLALFSYHARDGGFADTGEPGPVANWIGPIGAWLSGFFFFLFGRPAYLFPLMLGFAGWLVHKEQSVPDLRSRINTLLRAGGFVLTLMTSCGLATLHWDGSSFPSSAGGALGELVGDGSAAGMSLLGATLLLLGLWFAGVALFLGISWFAVMDRLGAWTLVTIDWVRTQIDQRRELASGQQRKQARQEVVREERKKVASRPPPRIEAQAPASEKSGRVERERQVPLFDAPKSSELPALSLLDEPVLREPSYSAEALEAMSRLVEIKLRDFGVEAEVVAVQPGPVVTRFEIAPGARRQGQPDQQPGQGPGARAVGDQRPCRRGDSGQVGHGPGDPEREAGNRHARRDHQVQALRRCCLAARAGARQGHRRHAGCRGPCAHAAPADRRYDRLRQVGRHQCDGAEPAVQGDAGARAA